MAALKADGLEPGFPDLLLIGPSGQIAFMEVKREGGELSEKQLEWEDALAKRGLSIAVVYSVDDAISALIKWGWIRE